LLGKDLIVKGHGWEEDPIGLEEDILVKKNLIVKKHGWVEDPIGLEEEDTELYSDIVIIQKRKR
jgi:hypothetical protein